MNTNTGDWTLSPNAAEFLPEEIEELKRGAMKIWHHCRWPHRTNTPCDKCPTCGPNHDRESATPRPSRSTPIGAAP